MLAVVLQVLEYRKYSPVACLLLKSHLVEDGADVFGDPSDGEVHSRGDLGVRHPPRHECESLPLSRAEVLVRLIGDRPEERPDHC